MRAEASVSTPGRQFPHPHLHSASILDCSAYLAQVWEATTPSGALTSYTNTYMKLYVSVIRSYNAQLSVCPSDFAFCYVPPFISLPSHSAQKEHGHLGLAVGERGAANPLVPCGWGCGKLLPTGDDKIAHENGCAHREVIGMVLDNMLAGSNLHSAFPASLMQFPAPRCTPFSKPTV